jgi:uncharacterized protein YjbI with pentapeptide repeats
MLKQVTEKTQFEYSERFQLVKNEELFSIVVSCQILAGSLVSRSTYRQVVFSDCLFFATIFQGVIFDNCIFDNCNLEFSHFRFCQFKNCNFTNCTWKASSSQDSLFQNCDIPKDWKDFLTHRNEFIGQEKQLASHVYSTDISNNLAAA